METALYYNPDDTICAISSPAGTGAIALVRISGPQAIAICDSIWHGRSLAKAQSHTAHLGYITDPATGENLDQALATVFKAPHSFTGDDMVELGIHGSRWIQRELIDLLIRQGARLALPGEFSRRAFAAGKLDLAEAEAVADMIAANSRAAHRLAMSQMRGDFSRHINKLRSELVDLTALLELELDFSEEEVEFASRERLLSLTDHIHSELEHLATTFRSGAAIKDGIPVAIIGPTNAGKSSLLNALLGDDRAIVSDIHGTTRDIVEDSIEIGPYLIRFRDTAGLRDTADTIEAIGIDRSRQAARAAGIVLFVVDASAMPRPEEISAELDGIDPERIIFVQNKTDLANAPAADTNIAISALHRQGIEDLRTLIRSKIDALNPGADTDLIVTNARHAEALRAAATAAAATAAALRQGIPADLVAQDLRDTIRHLGSITGTITTTEVLSTIFSRFCIGK
ncbi:MAG: tRNA uridine-5-carboxymethylaminomethyl(34) synthesis GTPase MnmE [Muribaculaceae bacterium]|nr:tRNA uridine-5-carboxymethylaminomethyl(34) synthesis GTPase MnmE [Muribaculaceae bacterium]